MSSGVCLLWPSAVFPSRIPRIQECSEQGSSTCICFKSNSAPVSPGPPWCIVGPVNICTVTVFGFHLPLLSGETFHPVPRFCWNRADHQGFRDQQQARGAIRPSPVANLRCHWCFSILTKCSSTQTRIVCFLLRYWRAVRIIPRPHQSGCHPTRRKCVVRVRMIAPSTIPGILGAGL